MAQYITANNIEPTTLTALSGPKIQSITYPGDNTAVNTAGGDTVVLTGTGFVSGCTVLVNGSAAPVVTFNSSTSVEFIAPALAAGGYAIYLVNPDGGTAIAVPGLQYSGVPAWSTASGSVGSVYETTAFNSTVTATGDAPVAYSLYSGSLPTGANLNSSTGLISGTSSATASTTTYNFTIRATDAENQDTDRAFSITVNPDVVTWSAPADNAVYSVFTDTAISAVTLSANSAAGYGVQYTANTLPTGLSLTANVISGTPTVEGTVSTLLTATANTSSRTAQRTINWVVSVGGDIYLPYVTTLLSASNSANVFIKDSSTNNFSVSVAGDTRPNNFNPYTPGYYSNYFDGTGDYLRVPSTGAGFSSITTFTYECWIYPTAALGTNCIFDISECQPFRFVLSGTNVVWQATSSGGTILTANYTWTIGAWHHVVFVRDNSNNISIFVNGTRYATTTYGSWGSTSSGGVNIGCNRGDTWFFPGYISNARFVKGTAVYDPTQTTLTVPTIPLTAVSGTSLLMCQSNRFIDNSVDNLTVTRNGDVSVSGFDPFTPDSTYATYGSTYFDGNGDYLTVPSNSAFAFGTGNYTIEAWVYITVSAAQAIVGNGDGSVANPYFYINGTTPTLYFNNTAVASGPAIPLNVWTHVAVTRSGTLVQVFTNGVAGNGATNADSMISSGLTIGASSIPSQFITGYISNLRIVKGTAVYTSAFTPSTQPLTAIAGTSLLTLQTNQPANNNVFIDNSTNNFLVTRNGNATPGTFSPYGAGWSNYFDGVDDYLLPTSTTIANFSTSDFTVECWLNLSALGSTRCIMDARDNTNTSQMLFQVESDNKVKFGNQTSYLVASTTTLVTGVWYHVAVARQSGTLRLFINGVLEASSADSTNYSQGTNRPTIGTTGFNFGFNDFFGYISNLRVVKGTAVYTSAFTSPSTPLQPIAGTSLLTCADNRVADKSSNNFTITRGGDVSVQRSSPFSNTTLSASTYSVYFDGSGDYLRTTGLVLNNGAFTISFYFYPTTASVIGLFDSAPGTASTFRNYPANTIQDQNGGSVAFTANTNQWNWMSIVGDGSNFTVYLNGSSVGTAAYAGLVDSSFTLGTINSGGDGAYTGYISNFRIKNIASVDSVPTSSLTAVTGTTFLVCQSDRIVDNSANAYSITIAGDARPSTFSPFTPTYINKQSYSAAVFGGSMYSDGTGDYLNINNVPAIGTGDFTIECWVYPTTLGSFDGFISSAMDGGGAIGVSLSRDQAWIGNNSTIAISYSWSSLILTGRWTHLAVTRQGSTVRFFVNGVVVSSGSASTNIASTTYAIGRRYPNWDSAYPTGYISDARVINGTALYTSSFVPPTAPVTARQNTVLLLNATSAGIFDAATQAVYETVGDTKINTSVVKFAGGSSVYLDGTGDYMLVKPTVNLEFGSGDFTIEFWLYRVGTGRMALYHGSFGTDWSVGIDISSVSPFTSNTIGIWASSNGTSWNLVNADSGGNGVGTIAVAQNTWTHIAYVRNGTTWMSFVNGVRDRNITGVSGSIVDRATSQKAIAAWFSDASMAKINGYISDFRITKGLARYTANFTPPTSALLTK